METVKGTCKCGNVLEIAVGLLGSTGLCPECGEPVPLAEARGQATEPLTRGD